MLLVAKNQLVPLQRPLTLGLVFWGWFLIFYMAMALPSALGVLFLARFTRQPGLPRGILALAVLAFLGAALGSNRAALSLLLTLDGPARFRWLVPAAVLLCALALLCLVSCPWRKRAAHRLLAALGAAAGMGALLPALNGSSYLRGVEEVVPRIRPVAMVGFGQLDAGLQRLGQAYEAATNSTRRRVPAFWNIASAFGSPVNVHARGTGSIGSSPITSPTSRRLAESSCISSSRAGLTMEYPPTPSCSSASWTRCATPASPTRNWSRTGSALTKIAYAATGEW